MLPGALVRAKPVPRCEPPLTEAQRSYLEAFDRFLTTTGKSQMDARRDMSARLAVMCAEADVHVETRPAFQPRYHAAR